MNLRYTVGKAGTVVFYGKEKDVWGYNNIDDFLNDVRVLGRTLDDDSMAWIQSLLIFGDKVVASVTTGGKIMWLREPYVFSPIVNILKEKSERGQRRKFAFVEDYAGEIQDLWAGVLDFDWESIMIKSSV